MIWSALVALVACAGVAVYAFAFAWADRPRIRRHGHKLRRPPDTLPLLGNAIHFLKPRHVLFDWFVRCQQRFGDETFEISVPSLPPGVVINSPDVVEFVLKNEPTISKGEFFRRRSWDLFGHGIINATGDEWRAQRKAGLKFFSGNNLDLLVDDVLPEVYRATRDQLGRAARDGTVLDLQQVLLDLTTTVVGYMAYDMKVDAASPFSKAFDHASAHTSLRFQNPLYALTELFTGAAFRASLAEVRRFGRRIVANARKRRSHAAFERLFASDADQPFPGLDQSNDNVVMGSLIDSLIETFDDPQVIADSALNFLSAGRDTTAQALTWTLYALIRHPQAMSQLRVELDAKFPPSVSGTGVNHATEIGPDTTDLADLDLASLQPNALPVTLATFYEALRLYPPIPVEIKQTLCAVTLPDGTSLPTGAIVLWCIWAMNRNQSIFGDDAQAFRPGRWLSPDGKFLGRSVGEFPVFNGGPRSCLGKKMAELMASWILVRLCSDWDFEEVVDQPTMPPAERVSANSLTLPMDGGLPCRVKRRHGRDSDARRTPLETTMAGGEK